MRIRVNKQGRILEVIGESVDDEEYSMLKGFNFVSLIDEPQTNLANKFIESIFNSSEIQICRLALKLKLDATVEYLFVGMPENEEECTLVVRRTFDVDAERKWAANSEARLRNLFNRMPVAMALVDDNGQFKAVNPSMEGLFGYSAQEFATMNLKKMIIEVQGRTLMELIKECNDKSMQFQSVKRTGEVFHVEICSRMLDDNAGLINVCIFDVSQRVKLERLKQEFVQMISHDIKTPLTSISLFLERLGLGKLSTKQPEELIAKANAIHDDTMRLMRLIDSLLTLDKLEEGFANPNKKPVALTEVINTSINGVRELSDSKRIRIDYRLVELTVNIDRDQIVQVLVNFLNNAIKYSPTDTTVTVLTTRLDGDQVEICIKDEGPGIMTEVQDGIFDRFARLNPGLSAEGTGLGLAICKAIVEAHNGTIGLESKIGVGSEFWFRVPI